MPVSGKIFKCARQGTTADDFKTGAPRSGENLEPAFSARIERLEERG